MARSARNRSRSFLVGQETRKGTWNGATFNQTYTTLTQEDCADSVGRPVQDSGLVLNKRDRGGFIPYHGTAKQTVGFNSTMTMTECRPSWQRSWSAAHLSTSSPPVSGQGATVLSRTNPSRPSIVPLTLIQDLYDIPRMLASVRKLVKTPRRLLSPKEQANQFLGAKFGWLPLIDDVNKLLHVGQYIDSRKKEIDRLYSGQGLKRRIHLGEGTSHSQAGITTWESDPWFSPNYAGRISSITQEKVWATVRWKPNSTPGHNPTDSQKLALAIQVTSGLSTEAITKGAWDLLPWTWMIDWFSNVGDYLTSTSNTIPATPSNVCVMRQQVTLGEGQVTQKPQWLQGGGGAGIYTSKSRSIQSGTLSAHLPFLDGDRLSVLGALFVQRFHR